jgi:hypothetical protein
VGHRRRGRHWRRRRDKIGPPRCPQGEEDDDDDDGRGTTTPSRTGRGGSASLPSPTWSGTGGREYTWCSRAGLCMSARWSTFWLIDQTTTDRAKENAASKFIDDKAEDDSDRRRRRRDSVRRCHRGLYQGQKCERRRWKRRRRNVVWGKRRRIPLPRRFTRLRDSRTADDPVQTRGPYQ